MHYTDSHEWVEINGKIATIGITKDAKKQLGEIVHVELPKIGSVLKAKEEACVLESTKAAVDIYSPVSGKVVAVNKLDGKSIDLINTDPENKGWLFKVELSNLKEIELLKQ